MQPEQENQKKSPLKQIRTFQGDVADALKTQNESVVSIQRKEQAKRSLEPEIEQDIRSDRKKLLLLILGILVLTGLGGVGGWYSYHEFLRKTGPPPMEILPNRLVSSTLEVDIDATLTTRESLLGLISAERQDEIPLNEIKHLVLRTGTTTPQALLTTSEFFNILDTRIPGTLLRSFDKIFMLGTIGGTPKQNFLLIQLSSFESAFAGMLNWETSILNDLNTLLDLPQADLAQNYVWTDLVTRNKDARALLNDAGEVQVLYSFFDNSLLIITDSTETLDTLITRLNREKLVR